MELTSPLDDWFREQAPQGDGKELSADEGKFYAIQYEFGRLFKLAVVVAVIFYFGYSFRGSWEMVIKFALLLGFPVLLFIAGFFERKEIDKLKGLLRGIRLPG